jgi:hypothetical protein
VSFYRLLSLSHSAQTRCTHIYLCILASDCILYILHFACKKEEEEEEKKREKVNREDEMIEQQQPASSQATTTTWAISPWKRPNGLCCAVK